MSGVVIRVENLAKQYRLGTIGTGTISHDLNRWWHKLRGKHDPYLVLGEQSAKNNDGYAWALRDINFEVNQGDTLGIIGKNGAGKSTLLKILSRVTGPTLGTFKVKGRIASLLEVGTGFHPELTGRENIFVNGAILGMTKLEIKNKLDEIIEFSGIEKYIDTPAKRYSSGMYVRLAFAVAAHLESEILIADEVLAVGDAEFQKKCLGKMKDISQHGRTVLFVSHNMTAVRALCSKGLLIHNGKLEYAGAVDNTIAGYQNTTGKQSGDILNVDNREGIGEIRFTKVDISSVNPKNSLKSGEATLITFHYKASSVDIKANYEFKFEVFNNMGAPMFMLTNTYLNKTIRLTEKEGIIQYKIKTLGLNTGKYKTKLFIRKNGIIMDAIRDGFQFEVENGNYFNNQAFYPIDYEGMYTDFEIVNSTNIE